MQRQCRAAGSTVLQVLRLEARAGGQAASGAGPPPRRATLPPPPHPLSLPQAGVERIGAEDAQEGGNLLEVPEGVLHVLVGEGALEVDVEEDREPALRAEQGVLPARRERPRPPPPPPPPCPPPPRGRLSILVRSISRSAKAERALKSSPGPSRSPNTTEVFRRSAPPPAPAPPGAPPSGVGGWGSRARWMKRVKLSLLSWMSSARTSRP